MLQRLAPKNPHLRHGFTTVGFAGTVIVLLLGVSFALLQAQSGKQQPPAPSGVNVLTGHNDPTRSGLNASETILTPANVNSATFGKLWNFTTDGVVDAQPLYVSNLNMGAQGTHNVLFIATENDTVYAVDAVSSSILWQKSLLLPGETASDDRNCSQITPVMGITATPAIYLTQGVGGVMLVEAMSKDAGGNYYHRLHSIGLSTGAEQAHSPVTIQGNYPSTGPQSSGGVITFNPGTYKSRPALLLNQGIVYLGYSSNCDVPPYSGWIFAYNATSLAQAAVLNVTPNGQDGALWGSGGGPAADANGNIYMMVGNGTLDPTMNTNGFPSSGDFGNSFLRLTYTAGKLQIADFFASFDAVDGPTDERVELGSSSPLVLPDMVDANGVTQQLALGAGKLGTIFIVNRNNMGKYNAKGGNSNVYQHVVGALGPGGDGNDALGAVRPPPVYFNNMVYFGANLDPIEAFQFTNAIMSTKPVTATTRLFNYPGASLSISANGTSNGIVWAASPGTYKTNGGLYAYPAGNLQTELYDSNQAAGGRDNFSYLKFAPPTVANGMVYVATTKGVVAFGLLP